jgi:hypothetical protein
MRGSSRYWPTYCCVLSAIALSFTIFTPSLSAKVQEQNLRSMIAVLASDEFEGRAPGTQGEQKTIEYIAKTWNAGGVRPGNPDGSWFQKVPLVEREVGEFTYVFSQAGRTLKFPDKEILLTSLDAAYEKTNVPVFYGGYGITQDGSALDNVAGKIVLISFEDPEGMPANLSALRNRRETLIKAGAHGVIIIAGGEKGNWPALRRIMNIKTIELQSKEVRAQVEGVMSPEFAVAMIVGSGKDWDKLRASAKAMDFKGLDLGVNASFKIITAVRKFDSYNVIGKIAGRKKNSGAVVYMAHWDHLGICRPENEKDRICNGAVDNASGIAVLTEVAKGLAKGRFDRDIYFVATTAEENGLLGAYHFADYPVMPIEQIVIAMNIDTIAIAASGSKISIVGRGKTDLDSHVEAVATKSKRKVETSEDTVKFVNSFIQRQDGWALTQKQVPAIMVTGSFSNRTIMQNFLDGDYHSHRDEANSNIQLGGAAEDADLHVALGKYFASVRNYKANKAGR